MICQGHQESAGARRQLPEMALGESVTGTGFQVFFESSGSLVILETHDDYGLPRLVFLGVVGTAGIMLLEALVEVISDSDVALVRVRGALDEINVFHGSDTPVGKILPYLALRKLRATKGDHPP